MDQYSKLSRFKKYNLGHPNLTCLPEACSQALCKSYSLSKMAVSVKQNQTANH